MLIVGNMNYDKYEIAYRRATGHEVGCEEQKDRPCVVLNVDSKSGVVCYLPITTYRPKYDRFLQEDPSAYMITDSSGRKAVVLLSQISSMDSSRLKKYKNGVFHLTQSEIPVLNRKLTNYVCGSAPDHDFEVGM